MTLQIYIPYNGFDPNPPQVLDAAEEYGERWLQLNKLEGEIIAAAPNVIIAKVDRQQIRTLCESYIQQWTVDDLRSYSEFRDEKMGTTRWLQLPESREVTLLLEYVDEWEDDIMEYLNANGYITEYE